MIYVNRYELKDLPKRYVSDYISSVIAEMERRGVCVYVFYNEAKIRRKKYMMAMYGERCRVVWTQKEIHRMWLHALRLGYYWTLPCSLHDFVLRYEKGYVFNIRTELGILVPDESYNSEDVAYLLI